MAKAYLEGKGLKDVAECFETATTVARKILKSEGVTLRPRGTSSTSGHGARLKRRSFSYLHRDLAQRLATRWSEGKSLDALSAKSNLPKHKVICLIAGIRTDERLLSALRQEIEAGIPYDDLRGKRHFSFVGVCTICKTEGKLHVDHDHSTGLTRGLLCHSCNVGLGHMRDSPDILRSAIAYLKKA